MDPVPMGTCRLPDPEPSFEPGRTYLVTASTLDGARLFRDGTRLRVLRRALLSALSGQGWAVVAWVALPNHYHVLARAPERRDGPGAWVSAAHVLSARDLNVLDGTPGRPVWNRATVTPIADEAAWLAGVRYVMENPVRHGYVRTVETWPFGWACETSDRADPALMARVMSARCDRVVVSDALHVLGSACAPVATP